MSIAIRDQVGSAGSADAAAPPRASVVVRAFTSTPVGQPVLTEAAGLADQHRLRAQAYRLASDPLADDHVVAAATRSVNAADAACAVLIDQIDVWAAAELTETRAGVLHTETLGQLVDRVARVWTQWRVFDDDGGSAASALVRLAWHQLGELADAYDDLITDLRTGRRRLPRNRIPAGTTAAG